MQDIRHAIHMLRATPLRYQHRAKAGAFGPLVGESIETLTEEVKKLRLEVKALTARQEVREAHQAVS